MHIVEPKISGTTQEPKKFIAFLACNRLSIVIETFSALLKCQEIGGYSLLIFLDRPKNDEKIDQFHLIEDFLINNPDINRFMDFVIIKSEINLGVWMSKLNILKKTFELGADFTLLLEDDVLLTLDALQFCSQACNYALQNNELITVSLYSTNLIEYPHIEHTRALKSISNDPLIFHHWGIRQWPFPWGLGLTKRVYQYLVSKGWNGNDQNMGQILVSANGYDLYPIISRSDHIGKSISRNGDFKVVRHVSFKESLYSNNKFLINMQEPIKSAIERSDYLYTKLQNDQCLTDNRIKILYDNLNFESQIFSFKNTNEIFDVDMSYLDPCWFSDNDVGKIHSVIFRIAAPVTILLTENQSFFNYIFGEMKGKPTQLLVELDRAKIINCLSSLT